MSLCLKYRVIRVMRLTKSRPCDFRKVFFLMHICEAISFALAGIIKIIHQVLIRKRKPI